MIALLYLKFYNDWGIRSLSAHFKVDINYYNKKQSPWKQFLYRHSNLTLLKK